MTQLDYAISKAAQGVWAVDEYAMNIMYLVEGSARSLVIDTGTGTGDFRSVVEHLTPLPYDVVCTHGHVDHVGGIGQFSAVHLHPADIPEVNRPEGPAGLFYRRRYTKNRGFVLNDPARLPFTLDSIQDTDLASISFVPVTQGHRFDLGGRTLQVMENPGHSPGSISLWDEENGLLFSGDALSKVLILPTDEDPLTRVRTWLSGAEKLEALLPRCKRILAGHFCPLDPQIFRDQLTLARGILAGTHQLEHTQADEFQGPMYHHGLAYFTLDPENLRTRDYRRML